MHSLTGKTRESRNVQRRRIAAAAAITVVIALISAIPTVRQRLLKKSDMRLVSEATANLQYRLSDARLSGDYAYRPAASLVRGQLKATEARSSTTFLAAAARIENDSGGDDSIDRMQALSVVWLYLGDAGKAVTNLEEALKRSQYSSASAQRSAALWNDLAVAHLQSVARDERSLVIALDAVENAYATDRGSLPIVWTRALVLEKTNQKHASSQAWQEYLRLDPTSEWSVEARKHLADMSEQVADASFKEAELRKALESGDSSHVDAIVALFPKEARTYGEEELIGEWAEKFLRGSNATKTLIELRQLAAALRATSGEALLFDTVSEMDGADTILRRRAQAFLQYKSARDVYRSGQVTRARQLLDTAERSLRDLHSHLTILANIYRAASVYKENRFADALKVLNPELNPCGAESRYYNACGVKSWIEGLALVQTGHPSASVESYERGLAAFGNAREPENVATVLTLCAETLDFMSAMDEAWADRMTALEMFKDRPMGTRPLVWMTVALAALRDHHDRAAATMLAEIGADAQRRGDAMWQAEALIWGAVAQKRIAGNVSDSGLDTIRAAVARIEDPSVRARSQANLGLVLAEIRGSDPAARGDLDQALEFYRASSDQFNRTAALTRRANVRATLNDFAAADSDLLSALDEFQRQAEGIGDPFMRTLFSDRSRELFTTASRVEAARGRPLAALWLSDRARRAALWRSRVSQASPSNLPSDAEGLGNELVRILPPKLTVVQQDLDGDQLRTWVIRDGQMRFTSQSVSAAFLQAEIARFRTQLQSAQTEQSVISLAQSLYDKLLRPVRDSVAGTGLLVYSPSPALRALPFSALHDGEAFLAERRTVAVARSLDALTKQRTRPFDENSTALIVYAADPDASALEGAAQETAALRRWYGPRGSILSGAGATPSAFMRAAARYDIIHIAAHGRTDRRPLHNAMMLGAERLRAFDVLNLSLSKAPLVVLAGCSTDDETSGRATLSLANAFELAGASAVIGSLWDVDDAGTSRLLTQLHKELKVDGNAPEALHRALKDAIRRHDMSVWSAFQLQL
jgi:CHAT domain-containing protein